MPVNFVVPEAAWASVSGVGISVLATEIVVRPSPSILLMRLYSRTKPIKVHVTFLSDTVSTPGTVAADQSGSEVPVVWSLSGTKAVALKTLPPGRMVHQIPKRIS
jgi:hypothetical protein